MLLNAEPTQTTRPKIFTILDKKLETARKTASESVQQLWKTILNSLHITEDTEKMLPSTTMWYTEIETTPKDSPPDPREIDIVVYAPPVEIDISRRHCSYSTWLPWLQDSKLTADLSAEANSVRNPSTFFQQAPLKFSAKKPRNQMSQNERLEPIPEDDSPCEAYKPYNTMNLSC